MRRYIPELILVFLSVLVWSIYFSANETNLQVIACDVGQGDAILIQQGSVQTLIDGGPDDSVLTCLGQYMPYWDHTIELVVLTHPESDHYSGLVQVFERYNVQKLLANSVDNDTDGYRVLKKLVGSRDTDVITPVAGDRLVIGSIVMDVLNPLPYMVPEESNKLGSFQTQQNLNDYSIATLLTYKNFKGLFTGDLGPDQLYLVLEHVQIGDTNYLKVPHHGSKNGLIEELLVRTTPEFSVISVGRKNRYGHPSPEILDLLKKYNVRVLRTDEKSAVEVKTDGQSIWFPEN